MFEIVMLLALALIAPFALDGVRPFLASFARPRPLAVTYSHTLRQAAARYRAIVAPAPLVVRAYGPNVVAPHARAFRHYERTAPTPRDLSARFDLGAL